MLYSNLATYTNVITPKEIYITDPSGTDLEKVQSVLNQIRSQLDTMPSGINQFLIRRSNSATYATFFYVNAADSGNYGIGLYFGYYTDYVFKCILMNGTWTVKQLSEN